MCGRARCSLRADDIPRACNVNNRPVRTVNMDRYRPSYNVSPGSYMPVVRKDNTTDGEAVAVHCMKWGLIPSFTKKNEKPDHFRMFNARSESIGEKASFRRLVPKNRCVVAVEGFFEWKKDGSKKQPYYIHFKDDRPLVFAALYDSWENSEGEVVYTFTILTTSSSAALKWLHDRMPVIFGDEGAIHMWLNGASSSKLDTLLKPYEASDLVWYPVTAAMGKTSFDGPECVQEVNLKKEEKNQISKFFMKETKKAEKSNPEGKNSREDTVKTNLQKNLKKEPDHSADPQAQIKEEADLKLNVPRINHDETGKYHMKRDFEEFSGDSKSTIDGTGKVPTTPKKKKDNVKNAGDKQPTLFSYFGKS